ncbi:MAG: hypothetical protein PVH87_00515 [Desulfobacteraceae bacterium]
MIRTAIFGLLIAFLLSSYFNIGFAQDQADSALQISERPILFKSQSGLGTGTMYRVVWVTLLAMAMAIGSALLIKRYLQQKGLIHFEKGGRITVIETRRVSPKLTVFLISVDLQEYLIVHAGDETTVIQHKTPQIE